MMYITLEHRNTKVTVEVVQPISGVPLEDDVVTAAKKALDLLRHELRELVRDATRNAAVLDD